MAQVVHPYFAKLQAMSIEECCALTSAQRAAVAAEIAPLLEQGYEIPPLPNFQHMKRLPRSPLVGCIYFLYAPAARLMKIGFATNVQSRVSAIRTMSPVELILLGHEGGKTKADESSLHRQFSTLRAHGEWFRCRGPLQLFMATHPCVKNPEVLCG